MKRIYLIDDDDDDKYLFSIALEECNIDAELSTDGDSDLAMKKISAINAVVPDLLFLDWNMPKKTGRDCLQLIRQMPHMKNTPVIIYTTSNLVKDQEEAATLGASWFLTKPNSITELSKRLDEIMTNFFPASQGL